MSINWVMLDPSNSYVRLPGEKTVFTSPPRVSLALQTPNPYPGKEPLNYKSSDGKAIITTQRLIYLPTNPAPPSLSTLQSFSAPLTSLHDTHVSAPFFGPNVWEGVVTPTPGGGIPPHHHLVSLKLTFRDGGAFDFHSTYERIREVVAQRAEVGGSGGGEDVGLEELPRYEERDANTSSIPGNSHQNNYRPASNVRGIGIETSGPQLQRPVPLSPGRQRPVREAPPANNGIVGFGGQRSQISNPPAPDEPPPGYEEVQQNSVARNLERSLEKGQ